MAINRDFFENITKNNVVEMKWVRRLPERGNTLTRRALATNSTAILNSEFGLKILRFKPPTQKNPINQKAHNLVTYWDLFRGAYRNSACESMVMVKIWPVTNEKQINDWWIYFRDYIKDMTPQEKIQFMDV